MIIEDERAAHQIRLVNRFDRLGVSCACLIRKGRPPLKTWKILPLAEAHAIYREHLKAEETGP